jgi:hypothetical protein
MKKTLTIRFPDGKKKKFDLPQPPRTLEESRRTYGFGWTMRQEPFLTQGAFPCLTCDGDGWMWDPNDPPCPIEGNKMRDKIRCPKCLGKKTSTKAEFKEYHLARRAKTLGEHQKQVANLQLLQQALDKLTPEEYKILGNNQWNI